MKKSFLIVVTLVGLGALLLSGCSAIGYVVGSGETVEKTFDYTDFTGVDISSAFTVDITRSDSYKVSITTKENIFNYLDLNQSGNTLKIRLKSGSYTNTDLKATITMPDLRKLTLSGATRGDVQGFKSANDFTLVVSGASTLSLDMEAGKSSVEVSGASKVTGQLKAQDTRFEISGASRCELSGSASDIDLEVSGASQASLSDLPARDANLNVSGASRAFINAKGTLNVEVSGASTVEYRGSPTLGNVSVTGASTFRNK